MKTFIYKNIKTGEVIERKKKINNDPDLRLINVRMNGQMNNKDIRQK